MTKYPEFLIYSVHRDQHDPGKIDKVKAFYRYHPEDRVNTTREMTKHQLMDLIREGAECKTGVKKDGMYKIDKEIYIVNIYGNPFIKVRKNAEPWDDLGKLETF